MQSNNDPAPPKPNLHTWIFLILLGCLILANIILQGIEYPGWCEASEKGAVCLRNWFNAVGNLLAFLGAGIAAYFALGQVRAAERQVAFTSRQLALASLPMNEARISISKRLRSLASPLRTGIPTILEALTFITSNDSSGYRYRADFSNKLSSIEAAVKSISDVSAQIYSLQGSGIVEADVDGIATDIALQYAIFAYEINDIRYSVSNVLKCNQNAISDEWHSFESRLSLLRREVKSDQELFRKLEEIKAKIDTSSAELTIIINDAVHIRNKILES